MTSTAPTPLHRDWTVYYDAVAGRPPRGTLLKALDLFDHAFDRSTKFAVDLGCGDGRDTIELLRRGWQVLAIDGEETAIARLLSRPDIDLNTLQTRIERFEDLTLPRSLDLVNASFCLPFCPPAVFPKLWETIIDALRTGGRFCGQLIGDRDSWANYPNTTHHTRHQVEALLQPLTIDWLEEEAHYGKTAIGEEKYWHLFHIVACKK